MTLCRSLKDMRLRHSLTAAFDTPYEYDAMMTAMNDIICASNGDERGG